jgi:hypothetical protein
MSSSAVSEVPFRCGVSSVHRFKSSARSKNSVFWRKLLAVCGHIVSVYGCPRVAALRHWCSATPQNHRPGQLAAHIALGITWCGLVGGRGHRKGQLRVLGSPSALRTKEPRTGGPPGGAGSPRARFFFCESPLIHEQYIPAGTKTGLRAPRAYR